MKKKQKARAKSDFRPVCIKLDTASRAALKRLLARPGSNGMGALVRALLLEAEAPILQAASRARKIVARTNSAHRKELAAKPA